MTLKEFKKYFKVLEEMIQDNNKKQSAIETLCSDGYPVYDGEHVTKYIELLAFTVGDESDWIMWYVYENRLGKQGFEAGYNDNFQKIDTVDKLYKIITTKI